MYIACKILLKERTKKSQNVIQSIDQRKCYNFSLKRNSMASLPFLYRLATDGSECCFAVGLLLIYLRKVTKNLQDIARLFRKQENI